MYETQAACESARGPLLIQGEDVQQSPKKHTIF